MFLTVTHFLHILAGVVWAGGTFVFTLMIFPMLAKLPAPMAKPAFERIVGPAGAIFGASGGLVLLLGILRAWMGGKIPTWADLLAPYGLTVIASVLVFVAIEGVSGPFRARFARRLANPDAHAAEAPADARRAGLIINGLMLVLIALMVTMGLGWV